MNIITDQRTADQPAPRTFADLAAAHREAVERDRAEFAARRRAELDDQMAALAADDSTEACDQLAALQAERETVETPEEKAHADAIAARLNADLDARAAAAKAQRAANTGRHLYTVPTPTSPEDVRRTITGRAHRPWCHPADCTADVDTVDGHPYWFHHSAAHTVTAVDYENQPVDVKVQITELPLQPGETVSRDSSPRVWLSAQYDAPLTPAQARQVAANLIYAAEQIDPAGQAAS